MEALLSVLFVVAIVAATRRMLLAREEYLNVAAGQSCRDGILASMPEVLRDPAATSTERIAADILLRCVYDYKFLRAVRDVVVPEGQGDFPAGALDRHESLVRHAVDQGAILAALETPELGPVVRRIITENDSSHRHNSRYSEVLKPGRETTPVAKPAWADGALRGLSFALETEMANGCPA